MVLYRKYRPQSFSDLIGQSHIKEALLSSLKNGKISHAYLFSGPRGTGKTSTARIFAKAVNCEKKVKTIGSVVSFDEPCNNCNSCLAITEGRHLDLIEIDAASNRGIDEIRELREKIKLSPSTGRFKVYIIDEAHMLTHDAFNALLKTLEEPPSHAIFILATTDPQKIPATVASRTTHFQFKVPSTGEIKEKLASIAKAENWQIAADALEEIAKAAAGAFRDAEVLLENIASIDQKATREKAKDILGKGNIGDSPGLLILLESGKGREAIVKLNDYLGKGGNVRVICESTLETLRKILLFKAGAQQVLEPIAEQERQTLEELSEKISKDRLMKLTNLFNRAIDDLRETTIPQLPLEMARIEATLDNSRDVEESPSPLPEVEEVKNEAEVKEKETEETKVRSAAKEPLENGREKEENSPEDSDKKIKQSDEKILKKIENNWDLVLKNARSANSPLVPFLKEARPIDLEDGLLTIEFAFPFHKQKAEERKYRETVESALEKITSLPLRFKGIITKTPKEIKRVEPKEQREEVDPVEVFGKLD